MNLFLEHIRTRILAGFIFLIPVFVILSVLKNTWITLLDLGSHISKYLEIEHFFGSTTVAIFTTLALMLILYLLGWLVKFSLFTRFKEWIENELLQYIPNYLVFKSKMKEKLFSKVDSRKPVLIDYGTFQRPGFLIETRVNDSIIFLPNSPDSNNGQTQVVNTRQVKHLDTDTITLLRSLQACGRNLPL